MKSTLLLLFGCLSNSFYTSIIVSIIAFIPFAEYSLKSEMDFIFYNKTSYKLTFVDSILFFAFSAVNSDLALSIDILILLMSSFLI